MPSRSLFIAPRFARSYRSDIYLDTEGDEAADAATILAVRRTESLPLVDRFFAWLHETIANPALLPQSPLARALAYAKEREAGLRVFLDDAWLDLDTNDLERALRVIPMGRQSCEPRFYANSGRSGIAEGQRPLVCGGCVGLWTSHKNERLLRWQPHLRRSPWMCSNPYIRCRRPGCAERSRAVRAAYVRRLVDRATLCARHGAGLPLLRRALRALVRRRAALAG